MNAILISKCVTIRNVVVGGTMELQYIEIGDFEFFWENFLQKHAPKNGDRWDTMYYRYLESIGNVVIGLLNEYWFSGGGEASFPVPFCSLLQSLAPDTPVLVHWHREKEPLLTTTTHNNASEIIIDFDGNCIVKKINLTTINDKPGLEITVEEFYSE